VNIRAYPWQIIYSIPLPSLNKLTFPIAGKICDNPRQFVIPAQLDIPKGSKQ
jgi:hypothetical protein